MEEALEGTVFDFFKKSVESFPNKDFQHIRRNNDFCGVSYKEAYDKVLKIGTGLMHLGIRKGDKVGLLCDNCPEWILVNLALQGIGAPDVPRNTDVPIQNFKMIVEDSGLRYLIVEDKKALERILPIRDELLSVEKIVVIRDDFKDKRRGIYSLDDLVIEGAAQLKYGSNAFLDATQGVRPDDISTIVYTSGTEGDPKGTILTHSNFVHIFKTVPPLLNLNEKDHIINLLPPWHLFERALEYIVLAIGASMAYSSRETFLKDLAIEKPTFFASVPRVWEAVYERVQKKIRQRKSPVREFVLNLIDKSLKYKHAINILKDKYPDSKITYTPRDKREAKFTAAKYFIPYKIADIMIFSELRKITGGRLRGAISGGAHLPEHIEDFFDAAGLKVLEGYGMTEAAPLVSIRLFDSGALYTAGKPIPGTEVKILDDFLRPLPVGEIGVIYVRGPQIMRGYTNPSLTRSVLSPEGWFNTGDLGRLTHEGDLKFEGREDDSFKLLGGEWIRPQPIEDRIRESMYISELMLVGGNQKFVGALIFPNWEDIKQYALEQNIPYPDDDPQNANKTLTKDQGICTLIEKEIRNRVSAKLGFDPWEEIIKYRIIPNEMTVGEELTITQKLRKRFVREKYRELIEGMYS